MISDRLNPTPTIKNLESTEIELDPPIDHGLWKDIIEVVTGVSSNAITVGGKITAGTMIYTGGQATDDQQVANNIFWGMSLGASVLDFLLTPLGYLYKFYKKEPVPFNTENNLKWFLAGITLLLAIISAAAAVTSRIISFITAGFNIVVGIISICKYFYDYRKSAKAFQKAVQDVEKLTWQINKNMETINQYQDLIRKINFKDPQYESLLNPLMINLAQTYQSYHEHCAQLKQTYQLKNHLERQYIRQKSPIEIVANSIKFLLAGIVLAGTVLSLNPATLPIGIGLMASAAVASLLTIIVKKTVQIINKRIERENESKRNRRIEIPLTTSILMKQFYSAPAVLQQEQPKPPMLTSQNDRNMLEQVADFYGESHINEEVMLPLSERSNLLRFH
jgi:hypothetical protein